MTAVWLRFRAELRTRWRAWLGLALLTGVAGGVVIGLAAGARRTDSAYSRFLRAQNAWDVVVHNFPDEGTAAFDLDEVSHLPQVVDSAIGDNEYLSLGGGQTAIAPSDNRIGTDINRFKILEGRAADPDRPEEAVIPFTVAEDFDLWIGDHLELYFDPDELEASLPAGVEPEPEQQQFLDYLRRLIAALPNGRFEIVGIEASPGEFPPQFAGGAPVHLTPAFARVNTHPSGEVIAVRLRHGQADVEAFRRELERRSGGAPLELDVQHEQTRNVQRSIHLQAVSLWILAGLTALVGALIVSQLLARQTLLESGSDGVLDALGMSRQQRFALGVGRAAVIGLFGALAASIVAILLSPLMPTGLARIAEPDPGVALDAGALTVGPVVVVAAVVLLAAWPAWRVARAAAAPSERIPLSASSHAVGVLSRVGAPAPVTIGVRLALEPGRGRSAVPVRTTLAVVSLGIAVLVATLTFGASLAHLLDTPRLYGVGWDVSVSNYGTGPALEQDGVAVANELPAVAGLAVGEVSVPLRVEGERVDALGLDPVEGDVLPPLLDGRAPETPEEIVLGERTREAVGVDVGDRVAVRVSGSNERRRLRVVGVGVVPTVSVAARLGEGAFLTVEGLREFTEPPGDGYALFLRLEPGAAEHRVVADLQRGLDRRCDEQPSRCPDGKGFLASGVEGKPTDIVNFGRVRNTPLLLGSVLALLAAGTLAHVLVSAIRRRRRDLALLKTLGFERRQLTATVAWQATATVVVALLIGVPVGAAVGRWVWAAFADQLGILSEPRVPSIAVLLTVLGALVLANLIAALPARAAARTRPANVLRAE
jgi:ABC-type lipoprotein release transport system permease subunit